MRTEKKQRTIHYKRCVLQNQSKTLQELLEEIFEPTADTHKANARREFPNPDEKNFRVINHHKKVGRMFFGQLIFLESGKSQSLITLDDSASYYAIQAISPDSFQDKEAEAEAQKIRHEFVESMLYFGAFDNHVVVLQSPAMRARDLETHLGWLLDERTQKLTGSILLLQDKPTEATIQKVERNPVKAIRIGTPVETREERTPLATNESMKSVSEEVKVSPHGMGANVITALLGREWFDRLQLKGTLDDANLEVYLHIKYSRRTSKEGQKILDNVATSLRNIDEGEVRIDLDGGGQIKGSELKLSGPIRVNMINGLYDETDLYQQMRAWMERQIDADEIDGADSSGES